MLLDVCMFLLPFIFVWLIISAVGYVRARKNNSEKRENAKTILFIAAAFFAADACVACAFMFVRWLLTTPIFRM